MLTAESKYLLQTHSIAISHVGYASKRICIAVRVEVDPKDIVSRIFNCPILKYHYLKELKIAHIHIYGETIDPSTLKKYYDAAHYIQDEADKRYGNLNRILKGVKDFKEATGIDVNLYVSSEHQNSFEMFDDEGHSLVKCGGDQQPLYGLMVQASKNELTLECKGFITSTEEEEKKVEQIQIIVRPEHVHLLNISAGLPPVSWLMNTSISFNFDEKEEELEELPSNKIYELGVNQFTY